MLEDANRDADKFSKSWGEFMNTVSDYLDQYKRAFVKLFGPDFEKMQKDLRESQDKREEEEAKGRGPAEKLRGLHRQPYTIPGEAGARALYDLWEIITGNQKNEIGAGAGGGPRLQKQSFRAIGTEGNPLFQQAGFGLDDHRKGIDANTEQLKQLNDLLRTAMGLDAAGDGFHPAGPGGRGFGGGGYSVIPEAGGRSRGGSRGGGGGGGDADTSGNTGKSGGKGRMTPADFISGMVARGWSPEAAAAMAGNVKGESDFDPSGATGDAGTAHGLVQWRGERFTALKKFAAESGRDWRDKEVQMDFLNKEYRGRFGNKAVTETDMPTNEARGKRFEGYATNTFGARVSAGRRYLHQYQDRQKAEAKGAKVPSTHLEEVPWLKDYGQYREEQDRRSFPGNIPPEGSPYDPKTGSATGLTPQSLLESARRRMDADNNATKVEGTGKLSVHVNAPKGTDVSASGGGLFKSVEVNRQTQMDKADKGPPQELGTGMPLP
jgi:hypothetical protein